MRMNEKATLPIRFCGIATFLLAFAICLAPAEGRAADTTSLHVVVKDAVSEEPIFQAQLTLQFREGRSVKRDRWITFSAKTDKNGKCTFKYIPKGTVRLMVTADRHQSYGKDVEIDQEDPTIDVKLRRPQPQI